MAAAIARDFSGSEELRRTKSPVALLWHRETSQLARLGGCRATFARSHT